MNAEKSIPPEVTAPGVSEKDLEQLGRLAADKFAAAIKSVVSADTVSDHDGDDHKLVRCQTGFGDDLLGISILGQQPA